MIIEIIPEPKASRGFTNLARYALGAEAGRDPACWERVAGYVLDKENWRGEIISDVRTYNSRHGPENVGLAVKDAASANARCITSTAPKTYHIVLALSPGEHLTPEQFAKAEQRIVDALGLAECKRISVTHNSKEHLHRHVAIATGSCADGRNRRPKNDYAIASRLAQELEIELGLSRTNHERGTGRGFADSLQREAMEHAHEMLAASSWRDLHRVMASHGLIIKPRGDGLVIGSLDNPRLHVRASRVHRELGKNKIEARLGAFEPSPEHDRQEPHGPQRSELYHRYIEERQQDQAACKEAMRELVERQAEYTQALKDHYAKQWESEKVLSRGRPKRRNLQTVAEMRDAGHRRRRVEQRAERQRLKAAHEGIGWREWSAKEKKTEERRRDAEAAARASGAEQRRAERSRARQQDDQELER